jgi:hypothetical protein
VDTSVIPTRSARCCRLSKWTSSFTSLLPSVGNCWATGQRKYISELFDMNGRLVTVTMPAQWSWLRRTGSRTRMRTLQALSPMTVTIAGLFACGSGVHPAHNTPPGAGEPNSASSPDSGRSGCELVDLPSCPREWRVGVPCVVTTRCTLCWSACNLRTEDIDGGTIGAQNQLGCGPSGTVEAYGKGLFPCQSGN